MLKLESKLRIVFIIFFIPLIFALSRLTLRATCDSHPLLFNVLIVSILISFALGSKKSYYLLILPASIIVALYAPIGFTYGFPSYQYISSLFATNLDESIEFFKLIPYKSFIYSISIPILFYIFNVVFCKMKIRPIKNRTYIMISIILLTISSGALVFIHKVKSSLEEVKLEANELSKYTNGNNWEDIHQTRKTKYDDYILIIGESARRDYFHTYGYPIENTPFIDMVNGTIVNGLESADTYTIGSLRLMLTQGDKEKRKPNYNMNIIGMANKAGFETYWLSNQGQFGTWDTPISSIAKTANYSYFTKTKGYDENNMPDSFLTIKLKKIISDKTDNKRFIVLHLIGSHPYVCDRVKNMEHPFKAKHKINNYIACYISSIKQTDAFLKSVYQIMLTNDYGKSFSIIYFSDHGMAHREINGEIQLNNNYVSKYHYDIPLVKISSDDNKKSRLNSKKSGLMFLNGLADWMGVEGKSIEPYNLFDGLSSKKDYKSNDKKYKVDDPAIDITNDLIVK
ncbi:phosphoethanolamine transferase [Edwardsiella tarda]